MNKVKEDHHWIQNYGISKVVQGFNQQYHDKLGMDFQGEINLIVFKREFLGEIEHIFSQTHPNLYLSGWLPTLNNDKSDHDFLLIPNGIMEKDVITNKIPCFKDYSYLIIGVFQSPFSNEVVVTLEEEITEG